MKRFEILNDKQGRVIRVSPAEDARIKREIKEAYRIINETAVRLITNHNFEGFGLDREIIEAIIKSKNASEPYVAGRFDARYQPDKPIKFYELNTLYAGNFRLKWQEEKRTRKYQAAHSEYVFEKGIRDAWRSVESLTRTKNIQKIGYMTDTPDDEDAEYLDREAKFLIGFSSRKQKIKLVPADCTPDDYFGIRTYLDHRFDDTLLLPALWSTLLDNKAIWSHAYRFNPGHPNLIPTSFDPMDFIDPKGPLHEYWQKDHAILSKTVSDSQGRGHRRIVSSKPVLKRRTDNSPRIYSAWMPRWTDKDGEISIEMEGFIFNGGRTAAYRFGDAYTKHGKGYMDDIFHYVGSAPALRNRRAPTTLEPV